MDGDTMYKVGDMLIDPIQYQMAYGKQVKGQQAGIRGEMWVSQTNFI